MRTPRRPPTRPHYEPRETEFVSLLLAETAPSPAPAVTAVQDDGDDGFPAFMTDGLPEKVSPAELARPVRLFTRKP